MENQKQIPELFGSMVFNDSVMRERLSEDVYTKLRGTIRRGKALDPDISGPVADAMRKWALQYALHVKVLKPERLVDMLKEDVRQAAEQYGFIEQ